MKFDDQNEYSPKESRNSLNNEGKNGINYGNRSPGKLSVTERSLRSSGTLHLSPSKTKMRENSKNNVTKINSKTQTGHKQLDKTNANYVKQKIEQPNEKWRIIASSI